MEHASFFKIKITTKDFLPIFKLKIQKRTQIFVNIKTVTHMSQQTYVAFFLALGNGKSNCALIYNLKYTSQEEWKCRGEYFQKTT